MKPVPPRQKACPRFLQRWSSSAAQTSRISARALISAIFRLLDIGNLRRVRRSWSYENRAAGRAFFYFFSPIFDNILTSVMNRARSSERGGGNERVMRIGGGGCFFLRGISYPYATVRGSTCSQSHATAGCLMIRRGCRSCGAAGCRPLPIRGPSMSPSRSCARTRGSRLTAGR